MARAARPGPRRGMPRTLVLAVRRSSGGRGGRHRLRRGGVPRRLAAVTALVFGAASLVAVEALPATGTLTSTAAAVPAADPATDRPDLPSAMLAARVAGHPV